MTSKRAFLVACGVACSLLLVAPATVTAGPWGAPSGSAQDFTYANGGDINGLFGDPFVSGNSLFFFSVNFQANAVNGQTVTVDDTVSWDIQVNPNMTLQFVTVTAFGSYAAQGVGSQVDANLGLAISELTGPTRTFSGTLTTSPVTFPLIVTGPDLSGTWSGVSEVDVSFVLPAPESSLHIEMANVIEAIAAANGGAEINEQFQDIRFDFVIIPEPATLALLCLGGFALLRRRRS